jgi:hypothetical protein
LGTMLNIGVLQFLIYFWNDNRRIHKQVSYGLLKATGEP